MTSLIIWASLRLWPIAVNAMTKETKVADDWKWFDCTSESPVGTVTIKQTGGYLHGEFKRSRSTDGNSTLRIFKFSGSIYGHTLILSYHEPDDPNNIRGTIILRVVSGRAVMYGKTMYFDGFKGEIRTITFLLSKNDNLSELEKKHLTGTHIHQIEPVIASLPTATQLGAVPFEVIPNHDATSSSAPR